MGAITTWRLRIEEAYLGAFAEFDISIPPGYYVFEDLGNPLCFVGRGTNGNGILFTFPLRHSPAWRANNIKDGGDASQALFPCYLPLAISRPPRVGGFLHPHYYGVPGHIDSCQRSNQPFYLVLHTFEGDGVVLCQSWAPALYRGHAASHFSRGGQITMKGFPTELAVFEAARLTTPTVVKVPELVPYIRSQLKHLEMVDDMDLQGVIHDPIVINNQPIGRTTPQLYSYNPESHKERLWEMPTDTNIADSHLIPVELVGRPSPIPDAVPREIQDPQLATTDSLSSASHSHLSSSEERKRSNERLKAADAPPPLPLAMKDLNQWVNNLPWQLSSQHWCHNDVHTCDLLTRTPETISLSSNLLTVIMRSATAHKVGTVQRAAQSLLQEEVQGINGLGLIKAGKGFELFQSRVKTGFSRGLGTATYEALWEYVHSVQQNVKTFGAYFERLKQLYGQVQLTPGCEFGSMSRKTLALKGLENGAYHDVLGPWVQKVLGGQHKIKVDKATMEEIQHAATNLLVTSRYYKDHTIQQGRMPARARAATDLPASGPPDAGSGDTMMESVFARIRTREVLSGS
jgi:hypothetical protein